MGTVEEERRKGKKRLKLRGDAKRGKKYGKCMG